MKTIVLVIGFAFTLAAQVTGPMAEGGYLLPSGWKIRPAGKQVPLETLPIAVRVQPDGKSILVLQTGNRTPAVSLIEAASGNVLARAEMKDAFLGLAVDGERVFVGGGSTGAVHEFTLRGERLEITASHPANAQPVKPGESFIGDLMLSADRKTLYAADIQKNEIALLDPSSGKLLGRWKSVRMPYKLLQDPNRPELLVTSWSDGEVARHQTSGGTIIQKLAVGAHTTDMIWQGQRLFVAAAHTNFVFALSRSRDGALRVDQRISVALTPRQPVGMTPGGLALSPDGRSLFVACSDANAVAVIDVTGKSSSVKGFVPTGWYPTATAILPDASLLVLNGKGLRSFPNPRGPYDTLDRRRMSASERAGIQYVGAIQIGGYSLVPPFDGGKLGEYTKAVLENSLYKDSRLDNPEIPAGNPVPGRHRQTSPIKHVIYIVKENRTYDQVFGDLKEGNGDPSLLLFDEKSSINHRKLAREFALFDNFYVNGDVSADGHNWSSGAIAPDLTNKIWPNMYGGRDAKMSLYWGRPPHNHTEDASRPHGGYLWTRAFQAGVTVRNYGWLTKTRTEAKTGEDQVLDAESKQLLAVTNRLFRGFDVNYPDYERMRFFLDDLKDFEAKGEMPRLIVMRLGNDHTAGLRAGAPTPRAMFADNDLALGQLVEAVSKSRFWKDAAIFVLEDDAQSGPDHVDSHRSLAFVISPYAKRKVVDSSFYNTVSMLRTMGLILGLQPLTHFDAAATPMWTAFTEKPDLTPFTAATPLVSLTEKNPANTPLARRSARLDFTEADEIDDAELNDILYLGLRNMPAPPPVNSFFTPTLN